MIGKRILLIRSNRFHREEVWLANIADRAAPKIGRIYLLIRGHRSATALDRFQRVIEESPVFEPLATRYGDKFADFLREHVEVVGGDVSKPGLGMASDVQRRLASSIDLIVNSSGLTDFNPDLRDALVMNVHAIKHLLEFIRNCDHAALLHLSTCYVVGRRDGRVLEELPKNYTPNATVGFDAEKEIESLEALIRETEARADSPEAADQIRRMAAEKAHTAKHLQGTALENQNRKNRFRWVRQAMVEAGMRRANELGWPNTYTLTKSLSESLFRNFLLA